MATPKLKGTAVQNTDVAAFIRKHGPASFSKPNGPDKTILYYPDTSPDEGETAEFKDYAGTKTRGGKTTVIQSPRGTKVVTQERGVTAGVPQVDASSNNLNKAANEAEIAKIDFEEDKPEEKEEADVEVEQVEPDSDEEIEDKMDYSDMTKDQLYKIATERDLEGRSTLNREQLIEALKAEE